MSETKDVVDIPYWDKRWAENRIGWHKQQFNHQLLSQMKYLTGVDVPENINESTDFQCALKNEQFLVPLCGKSRDMLFLLRMGFKVFGVEAVKQAIEDFNNEHSLNLCFDEKESLYSSADGRLRIYCGDFFTCPLEKWGPYEYIWDRGGLVAIEYGARNMYISAMQRALKDKQTEKYIKFKYLLSTVEYDKVQYPGPPRSLPKEDLNQLFDSWANLEFILTEPMPEESKKRFGLDVASTSVYLLTPK